MNGLHREGGKSTEGLSLCAYRGRVAGLGWADAITCDADLPLSAQCHRCIFACQRSSRLWA